MTVKHVCGIKKILTYLKIKLISVVSCDISPEYFFFRTMLTRDMQFCVQLIEIN